jgi:hypothetical protein
MEGSVQLGDRIASGDHEACALLLFREGDSKSFPADRLAISANGGRSLKVVERSDGDCVVISVGGFGSQIDSKLSSEHGREAALKFCGSDLARRRAANN